jgi:hypothetical protein
VLKEHYATKWTLDFYARTVFNTRQAKHETVAAWWNRLDQLISDFRGAGIEVATSSEMCGVTKLVSQLCKAFFFHGQAIEWIRTAICSRSPSDIAEAAKIVTAEERTLFYSKEKSLSTAKLRCSNYKLIGHKESQCLRTSKSDEVT